MSEETKTYKVHLFCGTCGCLFTKDVLVGTMVQSHNDKYTYKGSDLQDHDTKCPRCETDDHISVRWYYCPPVNTEASTDKRIDALEKIVADIQKRLDA